MNFPYVIQQKKYLVSDIIMVLAIDDTQNKVSVSVTMVSSNL